MDIDTAKSILTRAKDDIPVLERLGVMYSPSSEVARAWDVIYAPSSEVVRAWDLVYGYKFPEEFRALAPYIPPTAGIIAGMHYPTPYIPPGEFITVGVRYPTP